MVEKHQTVLKPPDLELAQKNNPEKKEIKKDKRIILEIGSGENPIIFQNREIPLKIIRECATGETLYIGSDIRAGTVKIAKKYIDSLKIEGSDNFIKQNIKWIVLDGQKIPLDNESIDEIIVKDVLTAPIIHGQKDQRAFRLFTESWRVLKKGSVLTIIETMAPYNRRQLLSQLGAIGFKMKKNVEMEKYISWQGGYAVQFEKPVESTLQNTTKNDKL